MIFKWARRLDREQEFEVLWSDLARYNAEVARGIVHTPEWDAFMAKKQDGYRRWLEQEYGE